MSAKSKALKLAVLVVVAGLATGCGLEMPDIADEVRDRVERATAIGSPSEPDGNPSEESGRPDVDPCDGSEELEEVVRYTLPEQFPESGGSWRGVIAAHNEELNPGPDYCFEEYAFGFLQPQAEDGEFNWVVVARSDWETKTFPTDLECAGGDAVNLTEAPVVEEMLCTTSGEESSENGGSDPEEYTDPPDDGSGGDTDSTADAEESAEQEIGDYYRAAGAEEWAYTYDHLATETRSMFTEEEWFEKNQWLWDRDPLIYHILSINSDGPSAEVELRITAEDDSSWTQTAYFVFEDGEWRHLFSDAEIELFMPGTPFDEFVENHGGGSSDGDETGGGFEPFVGEWVAHGTAVSIEPDQTGTGVTRIYTTPSGEVCLPDRPECNANFELSFEVVGDGVVGTVTSATQENEAFAEGGQIGLEVLSEGLLQITYTNGVTGCLSDGQTSDAIPECVPG